MNIHNSPLAEIQTPEALSRNIRLFVKRDDLLHPLIGGNKWRKLKYNLEKFKAERKKFIVSFGGAYSNHIAALAYAGYSEGIKTIGIIRGEKPEMLNNTLSLAKEHGMELIFTDRSAYRDKEKLLFKVYKKYDPDDLFIIPEGGCNEEGFKGCREIVQEINIPFDCICCPCGTGTTLAGITASLLPRQKAIGFSVMKNNFDIEKTICNFLDKELLPAKEFEVIHDCHFGGFAKADDQLRVFTEKFMVRTSIPIEPVYTGKMFYGLFDLIRKNYFKNDSVIIVLHTGGLPYKEHQDFHPVTQ